MRKLSVQFQVLIGLALISVFLIAIGLTTVLVLRSAESSFNRLVEGAVPASYDALGAAHTGSQIVNGIAVLTTATDEYSRQASQIALQQKLTLFRQHLASLETTAGESPAFHPLVVVADDLERKVREINVRIAQRLEASDQLRIGRSELERARLELAGQSGRSEGEPLARLQNALLTAQTFYEVFRGSPSPDRISEIYRSLVRPADLEDLVSGLSVLGPTPRAWVENLQLESSFTQELVAALASVIEIEQQIRVNSRETRELSHKLSAFVVRVVQDAKDETASSISSTREKVHRARIAMFVLFGGALFFIIPAFLYLAVMRVVRPITELSRLARLLGEGKHFSEMPPTPRNEIGDLGDALILARDTMQKLRITNSKLERNERKLQRLASTDPLTGAFNRRYVEEAAKKEDERRRRTGRALSLALLDLDRFKRLNDNFGHEAGDLALVETVRETRSTIRDMDVLARWGGEEFVILLPETEPGEALNVAERIRKAIAGVEARVDSEVIRWTVSIGIASWGATERDIHDVIARADEALYRAKSQGRNRVEVSALPVRADQGG